MPDLRDLTDIQEVGTDTVHAALPRFAVLEMDQEGMRRGYRRSCCTVEDFLLLLKYGLNQSAGLRIALESCKVDRNLYI